MSEMSINNNCDSALCPFNKIARKARCNGKGALSVQFVFLSAQLLFHTVSLRYAFSEFHSSCAQEQVLRSSVKVSAVGVTTLRQIKVSAVGVSTLRQIKVSAVGVSTLRQSKVSTVGVSTLRQSKVSAVGVSTLRQSKVSTVGVSTLRQ
jgi:DNA-binding Xre family transcriptional regulator